MNECAIETFALTKRYGKVTAVDHLSVGVPAGVVAGFIGPNGAGKTTTMSMLLGLVSPSSGTATVLGKPVSEPPAYLSEVGALIEGPAFYPGLTGQENLRVLATIAGTDPAQVPTSLELVGLAGRGGDPFGAYSMGMKQRLGIAAALLGDPRLLILDEPTNGLDPAGRHEVRQLLLDLARDGRTVLVSSHILSELEQVCDWLIIIDKGNVLFQGTKAEFLSGATSRLIVAPEHKTDLERLRRRLVADGHAVEANEDALLVNINGSEARALAADVNRAAISDGLVLTELRVEQANLEDRYLAMTDGGDR